MRLIVLSISVFLSIHLFAKDEFPEIANDFKSDILKCIKNNKKFRDCDFILIQYEDNYWNSNINYRFFACRDHRVDFYQVIKKKKNNRLKVERKISGNFTDFVSLIDSLNNNGLFDLVTDDFTNDLINSDGSITRQQIYDGISDVFAIYSNGKTWGLEVYEPKSHYDFSGKVGYMIVLKSIELINEYYRKIMVN